MVYHRARGTKQRIKEYDKGWRKVGFLLMAIGRRANEG